MSNTSKFQLNENAAQLYEQHPVPNVVQPLAVLMLEQITLQEGDRVLDAACGTGIVTRLAVQAFPKLGSVVGSDLNENMLELAEANSPITEVPVTWQQGDLCKLPFADGQFDVALCQQGLQFVPDKPAAFSELQRVLTSGGRLAFSVWIHSPFHEALAEVLERRVNADAAAECLAPYALKDAVSVRALVENAGFFEIEMSVLEIQIRIPPEDDWFFKMQLARSPYSQEIAADREAIEQEFHAALEAYRNNGVFVLPMTSHLVQARAT